MARIASARAVWARRGGGRHQDRAFVAYSILLGGLVVAAPLIRLAWTFLTTDSALELTSAPEAGAWGGFAVCCLWAAAVIAGATRGPAVLPPFLAYAWTSSWLSGRQIFGRTFLGLVTLFGVIFGVIAAAVATSLSTQGVTGTRGILLFGASGVAIGVIAATLWLAGECWPRRAPIVGVMIVAVGALGQVAPPLGPWLPWTWAMGAYPGMTLGWGLGGALLLTVAMAYTTPFFLDRLDDGTVGAQSAQWELAVAHTISLDLRSASSALQARPRIGRRLRAVVSSRHVDAVFFVRAASGAMRTPVRLCRGLGLLGASGLVFALAVASPGYGPALAAGAGVLAYAGVAAVSESVYHTAQVVADLPLYGISDGRLLRAQLLFPALVSTVATACGVLVASSLLSEFEVRSVIEAVVVALLALGARVSDALRGPSPLFLLSPAPSAVGDPMPALRILWALDAPIFVAAAGLASLSPGPIGLVLTGGVIAATCVTRWVRRD